MKSYTNCENRYNKTIGEVIRSMDKELNDPLRSSLKQKQILHPIPVTTDNTEFAREIYVSPDASILQFQSFREHINVLNYYDFLLKPSDKGSIYVKHHFPKAVNLVELNRYAENDQKCTDPDKRSTCPSTSAPALTFFVVEVKGSDGAEIRHRTDRSDRQNGSAPVEFRISEKIDIFYKRDKDVTSDTPVYEIGTDETDEMITSDYEKLFQSTTSTPYHKDFEDIDIDGTNQQAKYILSTDLSPISNFGDIIRSKMNNGNITDLEAEDYRDAINRNTTLPILQPEDEEDETEEEEI